jgi:hypothetical protein
MHSFYYFPGLLVVFTAFIIFRGLFSKILLDVDDVSRIYDVGMTRCIYITLLYFEAFQIDWIESNHVLVFSQVSDGLQLD